MRITLGKKIYGILMLVLLAMVGAAVIALHLTDRISLELEAVSHAHLPLSDTVSQINVLVLEQGVLVERMENGTGEGVPDPTALTVLDRAIAQAFSDARGDLPRPTAGGRDAGDLLDQELDGIEAAYHAFRAQVDVVLDRKTPGVAMAHAIELDTLQDGIDAEIASFRRTAEQIVDRRIAQADRDERTLLLVNAVLTALAATAGLGLSSLVIRGILASVGSLVAGARAIEQGRLDTAVPITTRDEVGDLSGSFNHMVGELRLKERIKETFGKYMDPRVVTNLLDRPEVAEPGGEMREMTVMFADLKGFTAISERLAPGELVTLVNRFFSMLSEAISDNQGVVDKYMGDAVMAYWGPPFCDADDHARLACAAAARVVAGLEHFRQAVRDELGPGAEGIEVDLRIGISTGPMVVGTIGSEVSRNFTVMGDPVNLGSRLEGANKAYGTHVLLSERTRELAGDGITVREIDLIRVKGKREPTRIFQLLDAGLLSERFGEGVAAYRRQDWNAAEQAFHASLLDSPSDTTASVFLERARHLKADPPGSDWDGVWEFSTK